MSEISYSSLDVILMDILPIYRSLFEVLQKTDLPPDTPQLIEFKKLHLAVSPYLIPAAQASELRSRSPSIQSSKVPNFQTKEPGTPPRERTAQSPNYQERIVHENFQTDYHVASDESALEQLEISPTPDKIADFVRCDKHRGVIIRSHLRIRNVIQTAIVNCINDEDIGPIVAILVVLAHTKGRAPYPKYVEGISLLL
jgi:hypothetical protein